MELWEISLERAAELGCSRAVRRMILAGRSSRKVFAGPPRLADSSRLSSWSRRDARGTSGRARPRRGRAPRDVEVGARERLPVGRGDVRVRGEGRAPRILMWARATTARGTRRRARSAAWGGHLEVLKWARANDCPWNERTCALAAQYGHLEVLRWARENDCPWNTYTCSNAAQYGHLEVLRWAHENDCPWNEYTCTMAAFGGHLEVLQWARAHDCPWSEATCWWAAEHDRLGILVGARKRRAVRRRHGTKVTGMESHLTTTSHSCHLHTATHRHTRAPVDERLARHSRRALYRETRA